MSERCGLREGKILQDPRPTPFYLEDDVLLFNVCLTGNVNIAGGSHELIKPAFALAPG